MIYLIKKPIPKIPKIQSRYGQVIYLLSTTKSTYSTNKKRSVLKVSLMNTLPLCQITWKTVPTSIYFCMICFLSMDLFQKNSSFKIISQEWLYTLKLQAKIYFFLLDFVILSIFFCFSKNFSILPLMTFLTTLSLLKAGWHW